MSKSGVRGWGAWRPDSSRPLAAVTGTDDSAPRAYEPWPRLVARELLRWNNEADGFVTWYLARGPSRDS